MFQSRLKSECVECFDGYGDLAEWIVGLLDLSVRCVCETAHRYDEVCDPATKASRIAHLSFRTNWFFSKNGLRAFFKRLSNKQGVKALLIQNHPYSLCNFHEKLRQLVGCPKDKLT